MYRKSLLALVVLAALPVTAATDRTLYVSTFEDEDGENASACSLREALKAATDNRAYGGCIAGDLDLVDKIKLKAGTYTLKKPLIIGSEVIISGGDASNYTKEDPYTNVYPARSALETTIQPAEGLAFSLFDSTDSRSPLNLYNVILKNGKSNRGGAIRAGGAVYLNRVRISNSSATDVGGAIYLEGTGTNLTAIDTLFDQNKAKRGAVVGMSCVDNLGWTLHALSLERTSVYNNGDANAQSIIDYCGTVASTISSSTIAKNTISTTSPDNAIIKYYYSEDYKLHNTSSLIFTNDTLVENSGPATLTYDNVGTLNINNSVLAGNNGQSCRYLLGNAEAEQMKESKVTASYNALTKPGTTSISGECVLPGHLYKADNSMVATVNLLPDALDRILAPLYLAPNRDILESPEGLFPAYIPRVTASSSETLINRGASSCSGKADQRGVPLSVSTSSGVISNTNACDIGSIELSKLTAANVTGVTNTSLLTPISRYEDNIEYYENIYNDKSLDIKLVDRYKQLIDKEKKELADFKASRAYRQVYIDVLTTSTEQEKFTDPQSDSRIASELQKFGDDFDKNYQLTVAVAGRGSEQFMQTGKDADLNVIGDASNILCAWNPALKQIVLRRKDNTATLAATTPAGEYEYCKYTITSADGEFSSTGYVQARIVNIAPIAKDDEFSIAYGSAKPVTLNILANDNDSGDGEPGMDGYPAGYPAFYQDPGSKSYANIKLVTKPTLGTLEFEYEQPCPDNSKTRPEETCYGGKITYTPKSTFSTFNDSFKYKVLDQDKAESNEATVTLTNTATTTEDTRQGGSGGGGSMGIAGLLGLASLILLRRKMK